MRSVPHLPGYDAWKLSAPEDGRRVTATCRACGAEHGTDPDHKCCEGCGTVTCFMCARHVCDGCGKLFCSECVEWVRDGGMMIWLCAECKVVHLRDQLPAETFEISPAEMATLMDFVRATDRLEVL